MTSLLGGNFSALANQLSALSQKTSDSEARDSPPYEHILSGDPTNGLTLDMFKDGLFAALVHPPPTDVAHSDTASSESPEPVGAQNGSDHDDVATEEQIPQSALSIIQSFGDSQDHPPPLNFPHLPQDSPFLSEATIRDLMPVLAAAQTSTANGGGLGGLTSGTKDTSSPSAWARNAGRKKSHPVWDFFKDMKDITGTGGVVCLHCTWTGDDRSPNNLRTHLKKFHSDDGIFNRFSEKLAKMTRRKQDCTLVMEHHQKDDSAFFESNSGEDLDASQIMALLEQAPSGMLLKNMKVEEDLQLTSARASEILLAAGLRPHKKTSEIWEHYKCLNEKQNVECIYCWKVLKRNDSSTKSMWGHMNAYHQDILNDGTTRKKVKRPAGSGVDGDETPTQPYVKRVRGGGSNPPLLPSMIKMEQKPVLDSMAFLQQLQQSGSLTDADFSQFTNSSLNFLDSLPKSSEVININVKTEEPDGDDGGDNHVEAASSSSSDEPARHAETPDSSAQEQSDQLAAFVSSLTSTNPMMFAMLNAAGNTSTSSNQPQQTLPQATLPPVPPNAPISSSPPRDLNGEEKDPSSFSLSEGHCAAQLMSMALDLEMTMSYHRRRIDIELCFESNRTAEKSGGRGKVICLTDLGKEIKITERVNGAICETEIWTKTDFNQFHWAIRGKCQKCFNKQ